MKKHLLQAFALSGFVIVFCACSKDSNTNDSPGSLESVRNPIEQLRDFRTQIETVKAHPDTKNMELMTLDDALWDVENLFNLTFSETEQYYAQTNNHDFSLYLPVTENDKVTISDAVNLYAQAVEEARNALTSNCRPLQKDRQHGRQGDCSRFVRQSCR